MASEPQSASGFVDIDGAQLWHEISGSGPPLVLLHAGIADSRMWDDQMAPFSARHRVLRYDLRGYGQSPAVAGLPTDVQTSVVGLARDGRFDQIPAAVPPAQADALPQIFGALQQAFVDSMHDTLHVGAAICVCAVGLAFLIVNPRRRAAEAGEARERTRPAVMFD